jgi:hypothetical protein
MSSVQQLSAFTCNHALAVGGGIRDANSVPGQKNDRPLPDLGSWIDLRAVRLDRMTVIIVRGGRGSGKTFLVRKVLACADRNDPYTERIDQTLLPQPRPTRESKDVKLGHILNNGRVFVVGWYDSSRSSGPDRYQRQIKQCDNLLFNLLSKKARELSTSSSSISGARFLTGGSHRLFEVVSAFWRTNATCGSSS